MISVNNRQFLTFQAFSLDHEGINNIFNNLRDIQDNNVNYRAFLDSAQREITLLERNFNAQQLSRTGFVFQEIKDLEFEVRNLIQDRSIEITNQACIIEASQRLATASDAAGTNSMSSYQEIMSRITFMRYLNVYPTIAQLSRSTKNLAFEPLTVLGNMNPLTNFDDIVNEIQHQLDFYIEVFEPFVDELILEMTRFNQYQRDLNVVLFSSLEQTRSQFVTATNDIRSFLITDCQ